MKQTTDLRQDALKWWNKLGLKKAECLGNKYYGRDYGVVAIDDTTDEEIEFIYTREVIGMQPQETSISNDSLENEYREFISENYITDNDAPTFDEWLEDRNNGLESMEHGNTKWKIVNRMIVPIDADNYTPAICKFDKSCSANWEQNAKLICEAVNNYNALKDENEKLKKELAAMYSLNKEGWGKVEYYEKQADQLKQSNKELIEALQDMVYSFHHEGAIYDREEWKNKAVDKAKSTLQKAKQL